MFDKKIEMIDIMEEGYNKEIYLSSRDITSHYHYPVPPCILPPDHRNTLSLAYQKKTVQTVTPLVHGQIDSQENFERNYQD